MEDDSTGVPFNTGFKSDVLVADLSNDILQYLREYDPVTDSTEGIHSFHEAHPSAIPSASDLLPQVLAWAEAEAANQNPFLQCSRRAGSQGCRPPKESARQESDDGHLSGPDRFLVSSGGVDSSSTKSGPRRSRYTNCPQRPSYLCHSCRRAGHPGPFRTRAQNAASIPGTPEGTPASGSTSQDQNLPSLISGPSLQG